MIRAENTQGRVDVADLEPINMGAAGHASGTVGAGSSPSPIEGGEQLHIVATGFAVGCLSCAHR